MAEINGKQVLLGCKLNLTLGIFDYDASAIYNKGMAVSYNGSLYTPLEDGVKGVLPTDTSKWLALSTSANAIEELINAKIGNIEAVLDSVIALQNSLIGGNV